MADKIFEIGLDVEQYVSAAQSVQKQIVALNEEQRAMKGTTMETSRAYIENAATLKTLKNDYNNLTKQINETNAQNKISKQLTDEVTKSLSKEAVTINEANQQITRLNKLKKSLNVNNKTEKALLDQINTKIDQNTKFVKENSSSVERQKMNIGNYQGAISTLNPALGSMVVNLMRIKEALLLQRSAMMASTTATNASSKALKFFKIALISTGIGAIVVALGALISYFASTQAGIDAVTRVTKPLQVIFQSLLGVVQKLGSKMVDAFSDPKEAAKSLWEFIKQNLINRVEGLGDIFKALGKIISSGFKDGYEDLTNASLKAVIGVDDVIGKTKAAAEASGKFFSDAIEKGNKLRQIGIDIEQKEAELVLSKQQLTDKMKEQELIAKSGNKSAAERNAAADKALELSRELAKDEKELIALKIEQEEIQQSLNDSGRKDLKELNKLKAESIAADTAQRKLELSFIGVKNAVVKEQRERDKKYMAERKKSEEQYQKEMQRIRYDAAINELDGDAAKQKLKIEQDLAAKKLEVDALLISEQEKNELKEALDQEAAERKQLIEEERIQEFENRKRELLDSIALENAATEEERQMLKAEQDYEKHLAELEKIELEETEKNEIKKLLLEEFNNDVAQIVNKAAKERAKQDAKIATDELKYKQEVAQAEIQIAQQLTGALKGLMGDSIGARILGIALDAIIEVAKLKIATMSAQQINLANATAMSAVDPTAIPRATAKNVALGASSKVKQGMIAASAVISGIGAIAKKEKGGYLEGNSHANGGIPFTINGQVGFEAEGGEAIINKKSTALFRPLLSAINEAGGGVAFAQGGIALPQPSVIDNGINLSDEFSKIKVINVATETIDVANDVIQVENYANL